MAKRIIALVTSLKLTVVLLTLGMILVFWGTLAQVHLGLYKAQAEFFRSFFIYWQPSGSALSLPIFPGGYTVGGLLLINLLCAHTRYYQAGWKKAGIVMIHLGVVLLLVGQFLTDVLSAESTLHLRNGETKNYSESDRTFELAIIDMTDPDVDKVVVIPASVLASQSQVTPADLPFAVKVKTYHGNSSLKRSSEPGYEAIAASAGIGQGVWWKKEPHETVMERRDMPSALVELTTEKGSLGTYLVSAFISQPQEVLHEGRRYSLVLRLQRFYKPFSLHLIEFRHDRYPGTDIPRNFSSRVQLVRPDTGEDREVLIYMNNPLRYWGETYYQASFDTDDQGTVLQVVRNPSWLTPYFSCVLVALGLIVQFATHLWGHAKRRSA
jgi:hypothetical protein